MFEIKTIVVPTDFSRLSGLAFEYAKDLAETTKATIHLLHVLDTTPPFLQSKNSDLTAEDLLLAATAKAEKQLSYAAEEFTEDSEIKVIRSLRKGIDYEEIAAYSKEVDASIIILATHSRTGALHNLLGSVAEKVIRYSRRPVLVIPPLDD